MNFEKNNYRKGLRVVARNVHPDVKKACIKYAKWVRTQYEFPMRVPVYIYPKLFLKIYEGCKIYATFFEPFDRNVEPYIRLAVGDYLDEKKKYGRDDALATILHSFSHELVHYFQWIEHGRTWEQGVYQRASKMVDRYAETTDHP